MSEQPERSERANARHGACQVCGGTSYQWGHPGSDGGVYFLPEDAMFGWGSGEALVARKCLECGSVQLFLKNFPN